MPERISFILSTGRTGTKALAEGLAGGGVHSPHQPPFSRLLTIASNYYLHGWLPKSALVWLVRRTRIPQIERSHCRFYVQVFSLDYLPARIVAEQHPDTRIVQIVRDPRTFVPSYLNWIHTRFKSFVANKFVPGWHPSGFFTKERSWRNWSQMSEFQRVCWHWSFKNRTIESLFKNTSHYTLVRFEDLFLGEERQIVLQSMVSFLGIPYRDRYKSVYRQAKNPSRKTYCSDWHQWAPERQAQLLEICGDYMARVGYSLETVS
jgi:hypothetical protein